MRKSIVITIVALLWVSGALASGGGGAASAAEGLIRFDPPQALGCVAVRVDVPSSQMLTGVRWWNGSSALSFPKVLVASGSGDEPPAYSEAMVAAESVTGSEGNWSTALFAAPVASVSGTLFVIIQYPLAYEPVEGGAALGVGWSRESAQYAHFVTGDGDSWTRVASRCRVLVEPILEDLVPGVALKRGPGGDVVPTAPEEVGLKVSPNPFNPETRIDLYLAEPSSGSVRVFDLRGSLVAELHHGMLQAGHNAFVWNGSDSSGKPVASGVYSVLAEAPGQRHLKKVLLVK